MSIDIEMGDPEETSEVAEGRKQVDPDEFFAKNGFRIVYQTNNFFLPQNRPEFFARTLCRARARIEQAIGKLERFRRIALCCERTAISFRSFIALAAGFTLIKPVHRT